MTTTSVPALARATVDWALKSAAVPEPLSTTVADSQGVHRFYDRGRHPSSRETLCPHWKEPRPHPSDPGCTRPPLEWEPIEDRHKAVHHLLKLDNGGAEYQAPSWIASLNVGMSSLTRSNTSSTRSRPWILSGEKVELMLSAEEIGLERSPRHDDKPLVTNGGPSERQPGRHDQEAAVTPELRIPGCERRVAGDERIGREPCKRIARVSIIDSTQRVLRVVQRVVHIAAKLEAVAFPDLYVLSNAKHDVIDTRSREDITA